MNVAGGPYQAIVPDYVEPERYGRASSWMSVMQFSGSVVGPLLATLFHGLALGIALALVLAAAWFVTDRCVAGRRSRRSVAAPLRLDANVRTVIASRALINVGFYTLVDFLFFFVRESLGVADARRTGGVLLLAFTLAGVAGAALAGRAIDRADKRVVVSVACVAIALAVGTFALAPNLTVAFSCGIAAGVAWGAFFTADWAIAYAVLPREAMASAMGVWNLASTLPQVAAPALTAPLVTALDAHAAGLGPRAALLCVIVEFALGTLWLWRLRLDAPLARAQAVEG
jgi:MFS family permease